MINQNIQMKINEIEGQLDRIRRAEPYERKTIIKNTVGDAETYLEKLLVWFRKLVYENHL